MTAIILICVIVGALVFAFTNGFHDSANAIATVVSTKVLSPRAAVLYGAILNFAGAFSGTAVAKTIGVGIVAAFGVTQMVILSALIAAVVWNFITWFFGIPSSSSHALIGGLIGAAATHAGLSVVNMRGVWGKVIFPMVASPIFGIICAGLLMLLLLHIFKKKSPYQVNRQFGRLEIISAGLMAFSHGANDTQKSMGIITLALVNFYASKNFHVPLWVTAICALAMALGTMTGGWRIIKTMGHKMIRLKPMDGFAAEAASSGIILLASYIGVPVSTTHTISGAILGAGGAKRFSAIKWKVFGSMVFAWILTIPLCAFLAGGVCRLLG